MNSDLLINLEKVHTTELGTIRIKNNLALDVDDVVVWCKNKIKHAKDITRAGKNWYITVDGVRITVNAHSFTIITAHKEKKAGGGRDRRLLLVLDMQEAILQKQIYEKVQLIKNVNTLIDAFSSHGCPVILSRHTNSSSLKSQSDGWQIDSSIRVPINAILLDKKHSNIFLEAGFNQILLDNGIKRIYICGLVSNGCVQAACIEGVKQGFTVTLLSDAHSTYVKDADAAIEKWNTMLPEYGVQTISTNEAVFRF